MGGVWLKCKKKPVVVEYQEITEKIVIKTREGEIVGYPGEILIRGVKGELYPCGREIFDETYDRLEPLDTTYHRPESPCVG